jgi:hypothetical protein
VDYYRDSGSSSFALHSKNALAIRARTRSKKNVQPCIRMVEAGEHSAACANRARPAVLIHTRKRCRTGALLPRLSKL